MTYIHYFGASLVGKGKYAASWLATTEDAYQLDINYNNDMARVETGC